MNAKAIAELASILPPNAPASAVMSLIQRVQAGKPILVVPGRKDGTFALYEGGGTQAPLPVFLTEWGWAPAIR